MQFSSVGPWRRLKQIGSKFEEKSRLQATANSTGRNYESAQSHKAVMTNDTAALKNICVVKEAP
jgi:hypothetical protein